MPASILFLVQTLESIPETHNRHLKDFLTALLVEYIQHDNLTMSFASFGNPGSTTLSPLLKSISTDRPENRKNKIERTMKYLVDDLQNFNAGSSFSKALDFAQRYKPLSAPETSKNLVIVLADGPFSNKPQEIETAIKKVRRERRAIFLYLILHNYAAVEKQLQNFLEGQDQLVKIDSYNNMQQFFDETTTAIKEALGEPSHLLFCECKFLHKIFEFLNI